MEPKYTALIRALAHTLREACALPLGDADERRVRRTVIRNVERAAALVYLAHTPTSGLDGRGAPGCPVPDADIVEGLTLAERDEVKRGNIITAIKMLRIRTGTYLKDARDIVCAYRDRYFPYRGEVPT